MQATPANPFHAARALQAAQRVEAIEPFRVMEMVKAAAAMRRDGIDVISMSVGEPDFTAPEMVAQAAMDAIKALRPCCGCPSTRALARNKIPPATGVPRNVATVICWIEYRGAPVRAPAVSAAVKSAFGAR